MAKQKKAKRQPRRGIALGQTALGLPQQVDSVQISDGFQVSVNGLSVVGSPEFPAWEAMGKKLVVAERGIQFAIGDFINYALEHLGEDAAYQIVDYASGWDEKTCAVYAWIAKRIDPADRRMDRLGIKHHLMVAALTPAKQRYWLGKAAADDQEKPWTTARLKAEMTEAGDVIEYWISVKAQDMADQSALMAEMESKGRPAKATVKRSRKGTKAVPDGEA